MYHLGKVNVIVNALSRKFVRSLAHIAPMKSFLVEEVHKLKEGGVQFEIEESILMIHMEAQSSLVEWVKVVQDKDLKLSK